MRHRTYSVLPAVFRCIALLNNLLRFVQLLFTEKCTQMVQDVWYERSHGRIFFWNLAHIKRFTFQSSSLPWRTNWQKCKLAHIHLCPILYVWQLILASNLILSLGYDYAFHHLTRAEIQHYGLQYSTNDATRCQTAEIKWKIRAVDK